MFISDKTSVVDGEDNHCLNVLTSSWSISSLKDSPNRFWDSSVSDGNRLRVLDTVWGFDMGVKGDSERQSHCT